jgi:hypothetical protein
MHMSQGANCTSCTPGVNNIDEVMKRLRLWIACIRQHHNAAATKQQTLQSLH